MCIDVGSEPGIAGRAFDIGYQLRMMEEMPKRVEFIKTKK
jgi:hypothetical protein